jgi:hypothetical protein
MTRKQRYREREKLLKALERVVDVLDRNDRNEIAPDRTTALMAARVVKSLIRFGKEAGLTPGEMVPDKTDRSVLDRFRKVEANRKKATAARYRRAQRREGRVTHH